MSQDYNEKITWKIEIQVKYKDSEDKSYKNTFLLDLAEFENSFLPKEEPKYNIEKHLKKISEDLHRIQNGSSKLRVISQDLQEYRDEQNKRIEEFNNRKT